MPNRLRGFAALIMTAGLGWAQNPPVPAAWQPLNTELQGILTGFDGKITAAWDQSKFPTALSGELLSANGNNGLLLLGPNTQASVMRELNALQSIGLSAVVVKVGFPLLYPPFLAYNGDPQDYQNFLNFYQFVAKAVHSKGMKLIVENTPVYPGFYSQSGGVNVGGWYPSLSSAQYNTARATELALVAQQIQPDYLTVDAEPDTAAALTGQKGSLTPAGWAAQVTAAMSMLPANNKVPIGAGAGFWEVSNGVAYIQALAAIPNLTYIDFHSYQLNPAPGQPDIIQNAISMVNAATTAGKPVAMSEAWTLKELASEYGQTNLTSDPTVESRDAWSFWAPLDQQFHTEFYKFANWKHLLFLSGFWSRYYWASVDYNQTSGLTAAQLVQASESASATALATGQVSALGASVRNLTSTYGIGVVSSASLSGTSVVAPGEIISIFGSGLASQTATPPGLPPTTLGGISVTVKDSAGIQQQAQLFYVAPGQVNLYLPATNVASGPASLMFTGAPSPLTIDLNIAPVVPGIYTAAANGAGVAAAQMAVYHADGTQTAEQVFQCSLLTCTPVAAVLGSSTDQAFLTLYGTGIRNRSSLAGVTVSINGTAVTPAFAGANPIDVGLDQVNVLLPKSLAGAGLVNIQLTVDGIASNTVTMQIQ